MHISGFFGHKIPCSSDELRWLNVVRWVSQSAGLYAWNPSDKFSKPGYDFRDVFDELYLSAMRIQLHVIYVMCLQLHFAYLTVFRRCGLGFRLVRGRRWQIRDCCWFRLLLSENSLVNVYSKKKPLCGIGVTWLWENMRKIVIFEAMSKIVLPKHKFLSVVNMLLFHFSCSRD